MMDVMDPARAFQGFLADLGVARGDHVVVHSSFRQVRAAFPELAIKDLVKALQSRVGTDGSIVMPAFTYCFKTTAGPSGIYVRAATPSVVGSVSEVFRSMPEVVRTSSATHSFALWGRAAAEIPPSNSPAEPLGLGSPLDWLTRQTRSSALMLGVDFSTLSYCHYIERTAPVPWHDFSPWPKGDFMNIGVSDNGEQELREVPRCSRMFTEFERWLVVRGVITPTEHGVFRSYLLPLSLLLEEGVRFFRDFPERVLCPSGVCDLCDVRRARFLA